MRGWIIVAISVACLVLLGFGLYSIKQEEGKKSGRVVLEGYDRYIPENVREGDVKKKRD